MLFRSEVFRSQINELQTQNREALALLEDLEAAGYRSVTPRDVVESYWNTLEPVTDTMGQVTPSSAYDFIQREVVPRRSAAYQALRQLTDLYQTEMQRNDLEFSRERRAAVRGLAVLLAVCIVLGLLVAWWTLRYADTLARLTARQYGEVAQARHAMQQLSARLLDIQEIGRAHV